MVAHFTFCQIEETIFFTVLYHIFSSENRYDVHLKNFFFALSDSLAELSWAQIGTSH